MTSYDPHFIGWYTPQFAVNTQGSCSNCPHHFHGFVDASTFQPLQVMFPNLASLAMVWEQRTGPHFDLQTRQAGHDGHISDWKGSWVNELQSSMTARPHK